MRSACMVASKTHLECRWYQAVHHSSYTLTVAQSFMTAAGGRMYRVACVTVGYSYPSSDRQHFFASQQKERVIGFSAAVAVPKRKPLIAATVTASACCCSQNMNPSRQLLRMSGIRRLSSAAASSAASAGLHAQKQLYDIVVVGGGIVGMTFAAEVARKVKGLKIAVLDTKEPKPVSECVASAAIDPRVFALSPKSKAILQGIGAWQEMDSRTQPYYSMQVWDEKSQGLIRFNAREVGTPELGCIVENSTVQSAVHAAMKRHAPDVTFIFGNPVKAVEPSKQSAAHAREPVELTLANSDVLRAKLVVAADGGESFVRKALNMPTWGWAYGQTAVVATVGVDSDNTTAWQRYLKTGPLALLPLWGGKSSIVWSTTPEMAAELKSLSDEEFVERLNAALQQPPIPVTQWSGQRDKGVIRALAEVVEGAMASAFLSEPYRSPPTVTSLHSPKLSFPLRLMQATTYVAPRVALVGDAAHNVHPMAGQGLNLGLLDADSLARVIEQGARSGADLGDVGLLSRYDNDRRRKNQAMLMSLDALHKTYGVSNSLFSYLRGAGMLGLNALGPIKSQITKIAMGLDDRA